MSTPNAPRSIKAAAWQLYAMLRELDNGPRNQHLERSILSHCERYQLRVCGHCRRPDWGTIRRARRYCTNCVGARRVREEPSLWF